MLIDRSRLLTTINSLRTLVRSCSKMDANQCIHRGVFAPPEEVRGMTELDREKFKKVIQFPCITIPKKSVGRIVGLKAVKDATIDKLSKIKPLRDGVNADEKMILLDPSRTNRESLDDLVAAIQNVTDFVPEVSTTEIVLDYDNWDVKRTLKAVLPEKFEFSGYSQVGHIAHLNLREELLPFRKVIGQILLDKVTWVKTVVNKTDSIATEFRHFDMELLAGEDNFITKMTEGGLTYKLDFKKVFWNSRLGTEHARIVKKLCSRSVVFDIFAGVGPFALPAAKKGVVKVFANDKNPNCAEYMKENRSLNKIKENLVDVYNLDATDFIKQVIGAQVPALISSSPSLKFHSIMNLPAIAIDFLHDFRGLLVDSNVSMDQLKPHLFIMHCHMFVKARADVPLSWYSDEAVKLVREKLKLWHLEMDEVHNVRKVAGRKEMYCVSFTLPWSYLLERI